MKKLALIVVSVFLVNVFGSYAQVSKAEILQNFVKEAIELSDLDHGAPIMSFNDQAGQKAAKTFIISKVNIKESLTEAKKYKNCIITVGFHTIVKVVDFEDCKQSGAWGTCMPKGMGLIQKGNFVSKDNYINNIIGVPDSQERKMFLFN